MNELKQHKIMFHYKFTQNNRACRYYRKGYCRYEFNFEALKGVEDLLASKSALHNNKHIDEELAGVECNEGGTNIPKCATMITDNPS